MDNTSSLFDVQKLGTEQLSKSSSNVTSLQKPLKKLYVTFQKNIATNPPLPYLKLIVGSQGIAFSPQGPSPLTFPVNTMPQIESHHPKDSIVLTAALQFSSMPINGKSKKFKGAFITLDKEDRVKQGKEYSSLFTNLDDKELFMVQINHPALFVCTTKSKISNKLDAHIFVCLNEEQALDIVKALKGQLTTATVPLGEIPHNHTESANQSNNDLMSPENQVPGTSESFSMQNFSQPQQRNPQQVNVQPGYQDYACLYDSIPAIQQLQISNQQITVTSSNQFSPQVPITTSNFQSYNQQFPMQYLPNTANLPSSGAPPSSMPSNMNNLFNSYPTPGTQQVMDLNGHGPFASTSNGANILHIPRPTISTNGSTVSTSVPAASVPPLSPPMNLMQQQIPPGFPHQGQPHNFYPGSQMMPAQSMLQNPLLINTQVLPNDSPAQHQQIANNFSSQLHQHQPAQMFQQQPPSAPIVGDSSTVAFHIQDQFPAGKLEPKLPLVPAKPEGGRKLVVPKRVVGVPVFPVTGGLNMDMLKKRKTPLVSSTSSESPSEVVSPQSSEPDCINSPDLSKSTEPDSSNIEKTDFEKSLGYFP